MRADVLLARQGLAGSVGDATRLIMAGRVYAGSRRIKKAGEQIGTGVLLRVREAARFVSRGGVKLDHALTELGVDPGGRVCLDAGCSTGGFTDCLLQRGAKRVYAVDVGYGQLAWRLRCNDRVVVFERMNVRALDPQALDPRPELAVCDLSFVSLRTILPVLARLLAGRSRMLLLVKPQFEVEREYLDAGVVRDPVQHERAVRSIKEEARRIAWNPCGRVESPLRGPEGNREFFLLLEQQ